MGAVKRTYALPIEIIGQFEQWVAPGKRSAVVAKVLEDWVAAQRRDKLRQGVIEGCREMTEVYLELERDFHPLEEEVDREAGE